MEAVLGIDVGGTSIKAGLFTPEGELLEERKIPTPALVDDAAYAAVTDGLKRILNAHDATPEDVIACGLDIPGPVADDGTVGFLPNIKLDPEGLVGAISSVFPRAQIAFVNDANAAALGEMWAGVAHGTSSYVLIALGTGVGAGIVVDGKIWSGAHGAASELGHLIIEVDGIPCTCGKCGCTERYCSATAIIRMAKEACALHPDCAILKAVNGDVDKITAKTVFDLAKEGDDIASRVFRRYVKYLTIAINNVVSFLDPDMIVLGGGVSRAGDFLLDAVRELLPKYLMYPVLPMPEIALAQLGNDAGIIGAALLGR